MSESKKRSYFDMNYYGTENWTRHPLARCVLYTDSVADFMEKHHAYWTLDIVASYYPKFKDYDFILLTFDVDGDKCLFYAQEDIGRDHILEQQIEYTDLDVSIRLYWERSEEPYFVVMFPSDH